MLCVMVCGRTMRSRCDPADTLSEVRVRPGAVRVSPSPHRPPRRILRGIGCQCRGRAAVSEINYSDSGPCPFVWPTWEVGFVSKGRLLLLDPLLPSGHGPRFCSTASTTRSASRSERTRKSIAPRRKQSSASSRLQPNPRAPSKRSSRACRVGHQAPGRKHDRRERALDGAVRVRCDWPALRECRCAHGRVRDQGTTAKSCAAGEGIRSRWRRYGLSRRPPAAFSRH